MCITCFLSWSSCGEYFWPGFRVNRCLTLISTSFGIRSTSSIIGIFHSTNAFNNFHNWVSVYIQPFQSDFKDGFAINSAVVIPLCHDNTDTKLSSLTLSFTAFLTSSVISPHNFTQSISSYQLPFWIARVLTASIASTVLPVQVGHVNNTFSHNIKFSNISSMITCLDGTFTNHVLSNSILYFFTVCNLYAVANSLFCSNSSRSQFNFSIQVWILFI